MTSYSQPTVDVRIEYKIQRVVRLVFFIYILSLIEGPLRKWFLPELATPLIFLRDPFVFYLYLYAFTNGLVLRRGFASLWLAFAVTTSVFGLPQYISNNLNLSGWLLGARTYWLYLPLALIVAKTFKGKDIYRFVKLNLFLAVPYAILVSIQYNSPENAFINFGVGADESAAVALAGGIIRPFGLFTYTGPNVQFTAAVLCMLIAVIFMKPSMRPAALILALAIPSVLALQVLTGSRAIYFYAAFIAVFVAFTLLAAGRTTRFTMVALSLIVGSLGAAALLTFVFPDMLQAMVRRFEIAGASEDSIWSRALNEGISWVGNATDAPFWGYGIGAGAPGVARFIGLPDLIYGEQDLARNINELGLLLGGFMLLLRFSTVVWLTSVAVQLARRRDYIGLPFVGFIIPWIAIGQITHSPTNAFLVWMLLGFCLALHTAHVSDRSERI